jgi:hypothetical protein
LRERPRGNFRAARFVAARGREPRERGRFRAGSSNVGIGVPVTAQ